MVKKFRKYLLFGLGFYFLLYGFLHFSRCFSTCGRMKSCCRACLHNQQQIHEYFSKLPSGMPVITNSIEFKQAVEGAEIANSVSIDPWFSEKYPYRTDAAGNVWCINHGEGWSGTTKCIPSSDKRCEDVTNELNSWFKSHLSFKNSLLVFLRDKLEIDYIRDKRKI
jgi:hypothetical protein